jgi:hypothetical protein
VDWLALVMISAVLFGDPDPDEMARALTALYRRLHPDEDQSGASRRPSRAARRRRRRKER